MSKKNQQQRSIAGEAFTELVLEVFKLNGKLITAGDSLTSELGLTSARWKVLGAISHKPLSVSQIARNMGLTRQNVQQIVNNLFPKGFVEFEENPDHQRAKLIRLSQSGKEILEKVTERQIKWANRVSETVSLADLSVAIKTLQAVAKNI